VFADARKWSRPNGMGSSCASNVVYQARAAAQHERAAPGYVQCAALTDIETAALLGHTGFKLGWLADGGYFITFRCVDRSGGSQLQKVATA
jgi:hypothetical protein